MPIYEETTNKPDITRMFELQANAFQECLVAASRGDSLTALIKSRQLDKIPQNVIIRFCTLPAQQADSLISDAIAGIPKWELRRKARNVKRRLLIALLCKHCDYQVEALKGAKFNYLLNLAKAKCLVTRL